jgi:hypothetical protein
VLINAHLAECILLSSYSERVLLQLPPVNALFYLRAITGLPGANGLAHLLLIHIHPLLERVLVGIYAIQCAYDVPIDGELAMDFRVRLSLIGRSDRYADLLLALPTHHSADPVRLLIPIAIARDRRRGLLLNETCFGATILGHFRQILLPFPFIFFCLLFLFISPILFRCWLPQLRTGRHLTAAALQNANEWLDQP